MKKVFASICFCVLFALSVCAEAVYKNDFTVPDLSDFSLKGNWSVLNGALTAQGGSGSAYLTYMLPEDCRAAFRVDVDFLGHTSTGGILIGGAGRGLSASPADFFGYDCFLGNNGKKAALGCYTASGAWSGNITVGLDNTVPLGDVHLSVTVWENTLTYRVTSLDGKETYFGISYDIGTVDRDVYSAFSGTVGLRKFYSDGGWFDNFCVTSLAPEPLDDRTERFALTENFSASCGLRVGRLTEVFFGMTDNENGYAFALNGENEELSLYRIESGAYHRIAHRSFPVSDDFCPMRVSVANGTASLFYDAFSQGENAFPVFEMQLTDLAAGDFALRTDGKVQDLTFTLPQGFDGETYMNPVNWGADPDILFYNGTYYLYNRINDGNNVFRVYTSPDLVHFTARNTVFTTRPEYSAHSYMSPNVFYHDGVFYLFYAALNASESHRLYYATSTSPYGPFVGQIMLHDTAEIGGHPFRDADGRLYLSYVRFGGGNHIWLEEVTMKNGVVTPVPGTLTKILSPTEAYEIDGYGCISEGGVLYRHGGYYYMIYATGHYKGHYGEGYAVSESIFGPYKKYAYNDILTYNEAADGVGDGILIPSPDGRELYMVYHRHYKPGTYNTRYTCVDKVAFVPAADGGADILTVNGPSTTPQKLPSNVYRYDIDQNGRVGLADALRLLKRQEQSLLYSGSFDPNADGKENTDDVIMILKEIVK